MTIIIIFTKYYNTTLVVTGRDVPVLESGTLWTLDRFEIYLE